MIETETLEPEVSDERVNTTTNTTVTNSNISHSSSKNIFKLNSSQKSLENNLKDTKDCLHISATAQTVITSLSQECNNWTSDNQLSSPESIPSHSKQQDQDHCDNNDDDIGCFRYDSNDLNLHHNDLDLHDDMQLSSSSHSEKSDLNKFNNIEVDEFGDFTDVSNVNTSFNDATTSYVNEQPNQNSNVN